MVNLLHNANLRINFGFDFHNTYFCKKEKNQKSSSVKKFLYSFIFPALVGCAAFHANAEHIAVLSDVHVTPGNRCDSALRMAVDEINSGTFDLVVMNGDITNEGSDAELKYVKAILDRISHPLYVLPGNHENNWSQSATKTFNDLWGQDRFVTETDSLLIVGINCGPFMKMGDGHIKQEDLHWLDATIKSRLRPGKKVLSFNHYPILKNDLDNYIDYARVLEKYPVILHVNGHYHRWIRYDTGKIRGIMTRALDMGKGDYGYSIVDINPHEIKVYNKSIGRNPELKYIIDPDSIMQPLSAEPVDEVRDPEGFRVRKVWTDSASVFTRLGFDNKNVYFGTSTGMAKAIDKLSGQQVWSVDMGAPLYSRPVALTSNAIAFPHSGGIALLRSEDGKAVRNFTSIDGPYVADGIISRNEDKYIQGGYKRMECRNAATGRIEWMYDSLYNYCQAAPTICGDDLIFGAWDTNLRCLNLNNGRLRWVWNNGKADNMLGPGNVVPAVTDDMVIIVAPDRYMTAIDRRSGRQIWRDNSHRYRESMGISEDDSMVYAKTMDGELVAVDARSHEFHELWIVDMGIGYDHAPCVVVEKDGVVYAGSRRGLLTAVNPQTQAVLWQLQLGVSEINGIDIDPTDGSIWVSLIEGCVWQITKAGM